MPLRYTISLLATLTAVVAFAIPARRGERILQQPDGSSVAVRLIGDESAHYYIDSEGCPVEVMSDGSIRRMDSDKIAMLKSAVKAKRRRALPAKAAAENNVSQVPHIGSVNIPVILVQYADYKFRDSYPYGTFKNFFVDGAKSAQKYFLDQSDGKFTPNFDIFGPVTLSGRRSVYGSNNAMGGDRGLGRMVAEGIEGVKSELDFSKYDNDGDGECDVVIILYAGDGEASSSSFNASEAIWPCQWDLETSDYGKSLTLNDTKVNMFAVFNELNGENLNKIDGIGTFCHEFSHCLGLPDFYDTEYGPHFGMGSWSVMDFGSYNDNGYTPLGYSAYEKEFMGWLEIPEAEPDTEYTLKVMNNMTNREDMALKITNPADPDEYYILENRQRRSWDRYIPAEGGLLITHFTFDAEAWYENFVNNDLQRATIIPADNSLKMNIYRYGGMIMFDVDEANEATDLWPQPGVTELTDASIPAATVNTGGFMSRPIYNITQNEDQTISFTTGSFPSGVEMTVDDASQQGARWFTLQGFELPGRPSIPGVYLLKEGSTTRKIMIAR